MLLMFEYVCYQQPARFLLQHTGQLLQVCPPAALL
jgi:hypothetical protein